MDFIKQMKKREFIEMTLKTIIAVLFSFVAIILMEAMIYSIELNALETKSTQSQILDNQTNAKSTVIYCIEKGDKYFAIYYNEGSEREWSAMAGEYLTKEQLLLKCPKDKYPNVKFVYRAPTAFELSITGVHYIVMSVFVAAVGGYFVYRFIRLGKQYKHIESKFLETGTIEF